MIGTFQGHEGAWIRGVCVLARFPFHGEKSTMRRVASRRERKVCVASEIAATFHITRYTSYYANFPIARIFLLGRATGPLSLSFEAWRALIIQLEVRSTRPDKVRLLPCAEKSIRSNLENESCSSYLFPWRNNISIVFRF